jgi:hypothetical protein
VFFPLLGCRLRSLGRGGVKMCDVMMTQNNKKKRKERKKERTA